MGTEKTEESAMHFKVEQLPGRPDEESDGMPAGQRRHMRRTTIAGDYGLGRFEKASTVASAG
jgi:hypothetical protein